MKEVADRYGIAIKALVHTRKTKDQDDWISDLTGTLGHVAAADLVTLIRRPRNATDGTLYITGRDVEEQELAVRFDGHRGVWTVLGDAVQVKLADTKKRIIEFLSLRRRRGSLQRHCRGARHIPRQCEEIMPTPCL